MTRHTFTARSATDLIAMAPLVLGFHPDDSIVLLSFAGKRPFQARIDLPLTAQEREMAISCLIRPVRMHQISQVAVLLFTDDTAAAQAVAQELLPELLAAGSSVVDVLRVDDDAYDWPLEPDLEPVPYDISNHEFAAEAVLLGQRTLGSRQELADQLIAGTQEEIDEVREAVAACVDDASGAEWLRHCLVQHMTRRRRLPAEDIGRILGAITDTGLRDVAWAEITHATADDWQELWLDVVRRCPEELLAPPAALLAFSAWLGGCGAMAWCAVDRCLDADPDYSLGHLLRDLLEAAVPPSTWQSPDRLRAS